MTTGDRSRVLHVLQDMDRGGVETWLMHVLRLADHDRFQLDFLVHADHSGAYDDEIRQLGGKIITGCSPSRPLAFAQRFRSVLREHGPYDVVHSHLHHFSGYVLRLAQRDGVPIRIAHSHLDTGRIDREASILRKVYLKLMRRWITQFATTGLAASRPAGESLFGSNLASDSRWRILSCSVDLKPFTMSEDVKAVRNEFGISPEAFVVGHVGRFEEQKNHEFLIRIAAELVKLNPDVRVLLVGEGSLQSTVERQVTGYGLEGVVIFAGSRPDIPRIMVNAMDAFLFPSLYEGLGLAAIEAQSAGLPTLIANTVPMEVDVVPGLVRFLPLTLPASAWAEAVLAARDATLQTDRRAALKIVEQSPFNITKGWTDLESIYVGR